ncbi:MAG TPA: hypothetical protein VG488_07860 [Candidatus Angelobacter sp.]|nr:hypothetical protein [Candidatus Angelobacter sp.]
MLTTLAVVLVWRKLYQRFPWFFCYIVINSLIGVVRFIALPRLTDKAYSDLYWRLSIVASTFAIAAVYEVFLRRLFVGFYNVRFFRYLFPFAGVIISLATIFIALTPDNSSFIFATADRTLVFVRVALLGFFVVLMLLMGRDWTRYEMGIAFGFGVLTAASFFVSAMWFRAHYLGMSYVPLFAWDISCVIWLIAFGGGKGEEKAGLTSESLNPETIHQVRTWEAVLKNWLHPGSSRSSKH